MQKLNALDIVIFIAYFVIVTFIGFFMGRRKKDSARDYFVTSSRLPWYLIAFGMLASSISTEQFIGSAGFTYKHGLAVFNWELGNWPAMLILLWIFLPIYLNKKIVTIPSYLEQRFGPGPRNLYAAITILAAVFIILPGVLYTGGLLLEEMFGIPKFFGIWLMAIVGGAFTIYGGLISVAWTQLFQSALLLASGLLILVLAVNKIDGGFWAILMPENVEPVRRHLMLPASHPELPWTAILAIVIPVNIWYFCTAQYIVESCLGAKSRWDGKMGIILLGFLMICTALSVEFPGLIAYQLNPNLDVADKAYPFVVKQLVPIGLKGLVMAGLCAAVMSTIQALMHSSSAIFTMDLYRRIKTDAGELNLITVGRIASATVLIVGTLWAPVVGSFPTIFQFFQNCWSLIAGPVAAVFILGVLWKRATSTAAFWTLITCFPLFLLPYAIPLIEKTYNTSINEFNVAGVIFMIMLVFMFIVSLVTAAPNPVQIEGLVWKPAMMRLPEEELAAGYPWYKNLWLWCFLWVALMVAIYIKFW
jgi:SSS family solute:Na+ symporter